MILLLWDIDGTLVSTGKAGESAIFVALEKAFDLREVSLEGVSYRGRTDMRIAQSVFEKNQIENSASNFKTYAEAYLEALETILPQRKGFLFPGIQSILDTTQNHPDIRQGLLTGNFKKGAQLKLGHYHIWNYFECGAFADDAIDRNDLSPIALQRAQEHFKYPFKPTDVFVIGDTPHDIECGKKIGAQTVAVATGGYSQKELASYTPSLLFKDLSDTSMFFEQILERSSV